MQLSLKQNPTKLYNLEYWLGNKISETICYNLPYTICKSKFIKLAASTHKAGIFKFKPNK